MCETTTVIIDTSNIKVEDGGLIHLEECPEDDESKQFFSFEHCFIFTLCLFAVYKEFFALTFSPNFLVTFAFIEVGFKTGLIENSNLLFFNYNSVLRAKIILHTVVLETCTFSDC